MLKETYNSKELINILNKLYLDKQYKKPNSLPRFNLQEMLFIRDLIFWKPKGLLFFYIADYIMNDTMVKYMPMFNKPMIKKLYFFKNLFSSRSAKDAAIKAGYSPKTATQQASRIVKEISGYKRQK